MTIGSEARAVQTGRSVRMFLVTPIAMSMFNRFLQQAG